MPTKRRFYIFLLVLAVMLLVKYAAGQETVGWTDAGLCFHFPYYYIVEVMRYSVLFGLITGVFRALLRNQAARAGTYFSGDLVTLRIPSETRS